MGMCGSREKAALLAGAPPEEDFVYRAECRIRLCDVDFETF